MKLTHLINFFLYLVKIKRTKIRKDRSFTSKTKIKRSIRNKKKLKKKNDTHIHINHSFHQLKSLQPFKLSAIRVIIQIY